MWEFRCGDVFAYRISRLWDASKVLTALYCYRVQKPFGKQYAESIQSEKIAPPNWNMQMQYALCSCRNLVCLKYSIMLSNNGIINSLCYSISSSLSPQLPSLLVSDWAVLRHVPNLGINTKRSLAWEHFKYATQPLLPAYFFSFFFFFYHHRLSKLEWPDPPLKLLRLACRMWQLQPEKCILLLQF